MISVKEAKKILFDTVPQPVSKSQTIATSSGFILAEDLYSPIDVPRFDNSAMDGYAFSYADYKENKKLKVTQVVQAGTAFMPDIRPGEAVRIFTGAPIPAGLDTVSMQEMVEVVDGILKFSGEVIQGDNIRRAASQTTQGECVATKGTLLNPGMIGYLSGLGIAYIEIFEAPKVTVLTSGKELVPPGNPLSFGQIYESSSYALQAALGELQVRVNKPPIVDDKRELMFEAIDKALQETDILLITGGISVGDYDFVQAILEELNIERLFYKIKQRPGKPLFAGKKGNKLVFGLPGNPASTLTCFYQYVKPAILLMMGKGDHIKEAQLLPLKDSFQKKEGLTFFMKGLVEKGGVRVLTDQESYKMNTFAYSDCLVELDEERSFFEKGEVVKVHFLS